MYHTIGERSQVDNNISIKYVNYSHKFLSPP
jgi:hypothetical protein